MTQMKRPWLPLAWSSASCFYLMRNQFFRNPVLGAFDLWVSTPMDVPLLCIAKAWAAFAPEQHKFCAKLYAFLSSFQEVKISPPWNQGKLMVGKLAFPLCISLTISFPSQREIFHTHQRCPVRCGKITENSSTKNETPKKIGNNLSDFHLFSWFFSTSPQKKH